MKAEDFLDQEIEPVGKKITSRGMSAEAFLDMPTEKPIGEPAVAGPAFVQEGQPPTMLERGKEAVTEFFRPSFAPEPEEDWRRAVEPTIPRRELRADGTEKGPGFLGPLQRPDGKISTELSIGVNLEGKETEIPCLVPTLEQDEVDYLLGGGKPTEAIVQKAVDHARIRIGEGESPFAQAEPATAGLTPEEIALGRPISTITGKPVPTPEERMPGGITEPGKYDFMDRAREIKEEGVIPFVGFVSGAKEIKDIARIAAVAYKLKRGDAVTPEERIDLLEFVEKANRDTTFGYKVINTVAAMPAFMQEFLATGPVYRGVQKVTKEGMTRGIKHYLGKSGAKLLEKDLGKVGMGVAAGVAGATIQAPIMGAPRLISGTIERSMPKLKLSRDEQGNINAVIAGEGEELLVAATKSLGDQWAETVSEHGGSFFNILGRLAKNAAVRAGLFSATMKVNPGMSPNKVNSLFHQVGYHGVINEMMEEELGRELRAVLGVQEYKIPTAEQLAVELVSFSVPGVIQVLGARAFRGPEPMEVPPVPPAAPDLSETQRELAREAIREKIEEYVPEDIEAIYARATERARYEPAVPPTPEEIEYEAYEPGIPGVELAAPEVRIKKAPPTYPPGAEYVAGKPAPEELEVEYKPILGPHGLPWKEEGGALKAFGSKRLKDMGITEETHEVVPVKNGFGVARKAVEVPPVKEEIPIEPKKPVVEKPPAVEIPKERQIYKMTSAEAVKYENTDLFLSSELEQLHNHRARVLGFEKAGGSFVEGYLIKLAEVAEKTDTPLALAAYEALSTYKKGNIEQATLDAEKVLGKLHEKEVKALTHDKIIELHKQDIWKALKSGELTPEKYAELHEKDYGSLAEFMPEAAKAPSEVPGIKEIPEVPKILRVPEKVVKPAPEVKKPEAEKPFEPDLAAMPSEKITVETKALREATGEMVTTKENAKEALTRIDEEIAKYKKLLECL